MATGQPAFDFYQQIGHRHETTATACNLAEASFELGDTDDAERYARIAIDQEEPLAVPYSFYTLALVRHHAQMKSEEAQGILRQCCSLAQ